MYFKVNNISKISFYGDPFNSMKKMAKEELKKFGRDCGRKYQES